MADWSGRNEAAIELFEEATEFYVAQERKRDAARVIARSGNPLGRTGRNEESQRRAREALDLFSIEEIDEVAASLNYEAGRAISGLGRTDEAGPFLDRALDMAEALEIPALIARGLNAQALGALMSGRYEEARVLYDGALAMAERHRLPDRAAVANNSADLHMKRDMPDAIETCEGAVSLIRQLGQRSLEDAALGNLMMSLIWRGRWDEAERIGRDALVAAEGSDYEPEDVHYPLALLLALRGDPGAARTHLDAIASWGRATTPRRAASTSRWTVSLRWRRVTSSTRLTHSTRPPSTRSKPSEPRPTDPGMAWADGVEAALALGRIEVADELVFKLAEQPRGRVAPLLRAELARAQALVAATRSEDAEVEANFQSAIDGFAVLGFPFWRARAQADFAAWLIDRGRASDAEPHLNEAAVALGELGAEPLLTRVRELASSADRAAA